MKDDPRDRTAGRAPYFEVGLSGTNLERAGEHNQRVTLQAIRANGFLSKAEIADITGLTAPAIGNITRRLIADGLIREAGHVRGARGQPALRLAINADGAFSLGVNIDREHVTIIALDFLGEVRARASREMSFPSPAVVAAFVSDRFAKFCASGLIRTDRLAGIGVAVPDDLAKVDLPRRPAGYEAWAQADIGALFAPLHSTAVHVANDATAAAIGELQFGHGLRSQSFFYILISAGLGGGLVIEGHPVAGSTKRSGEIGFLPVRAQSGGKGVLQDVASLSGLYSALETSGLRVSSPDALRGLDAARRAIAETWCQQAAELLYQPIMVINAAVNPEAIFLGGRLPEPIIGMLVQQIDARLRRRAGGMPAIAPVLRAALAEDAAAMGAAVLPFSDRFLPMRSTLMKTER